MLVAMALAYGIKANSDQTKRIGGLAELQLQQTYEQSLENGQNIAGLTEFLRCALLIRPEERSLDKINACIEGAEFAPEPTPVPSAQTRFRTRAVFVTPSPHPTPQPTERKTPPPSRRPSPSTPKPTPTPTVCLQDTGICVAQQEED